MSDAPFHFDRYINGILMAEGVCVERATTLPQAMIVAARIASKGPRGEIPVLVYRPRAAIDLTPTPADASPASDPVSKLDSWQSWIDDLPLPADFDEGKAGLQEYLAEALSIIHQMQDALIWCSAAADFAPEGQARVGWLKLCKPLIDRQPRDPAAVLAEALALPEVKALVEAAEAVIRDFHGDNAIGVAHLTKLRAALKGVK